MQQLHVLLPEREGTINPNIYGHFTEHIGRCMYDGIYVGEHAGIANYEGFRADLVDALKRIRPSVIRWPGGCFAENYDWRNGIGLKALRPETISAWYGYDGSTESNLVGTREFIRFCRMVGAEPYIAVGVNCMTPAQIAQWIEYCNMPQGRTSLARLREQNGDAEPFHIKYWGIGNENWGSGGNLEPREYSMMYARIAALAYPLAKGCEFIACGALNNDLNWTRGFLDPSSKKTWEGTKLDHYSVHYYTVPEEDRDETAFDRASYLSMIQKAKYMETLVSQQSAMLDLYDPERKIGLVLDEWGCWHSAFRNATPEKSLFYQQNTMLDAVAAALTLCIFNNHCARISMANLAQMTNCVHSLFLTEGDKLVLTPTYHVYDMMQRHQGGSAIHCCCDDASGDTIYSASEKDGSVTVTLVNATYDETKNVCLRFHGRSIDAGAEQLLLAGETPQAYNDFTAPNRVVPVKCACAGDAHTVAVTLPPASVSVVTCRLC